MVGIPLAVGISAILDNVVAGISAQPIMPVFSNVTKDSFDKYIQKEIDEILKDLTANLSVNIDRD